MPIKGGRWGWGLWGRKEKERKKRKKGSRGTENERSRIKMERERKDEGEKKPGAFNPWDEVPGFFQGRSPVTIA